MDREAPRLDELLSHRPLGRVLEAGGIGDEFALIRQAFEQLGKSIPKVSDFERLGRGSGTHLLKLVTPRAPTGQSVVRIIGKGANRHPALFPSVDAKLAPVAKLVFRPLEVSGHPTRSLAEHILSPDEISPLVTRGFADAFHQDALEALRNALTTPPPIIDKLPAEEFPIIFLPRPGGGDLQATPLAPVEAYVRFGEVTEAYFPRGRWQRQLVADKPQNISSAVGQKRTRFFATMPTVLDDRSAELHRYTQGGRFPRWRDSAVVDAVDAYAKLLSIDYRNHDIVAALDRRADALIGAAREFIDETVADANADDPARELPDPPLVTTVLLDHSWPNDGFDRARRVLTSGHFKERLYKAGEA